MTAMTKTACAAGAWTQVLAAVGANTTVTVQNLNPALPAMVRIGSAAVVGDSLESAADILYPRELRSYALATGDKIFARPMISSGDQGPQSIDINVRA